MTAAASLAQPSRAVGTSLSPRQIAAIVLGNGLDFYDFVTFSFFAAQIGRALFPPGGNQLLFALATFGVGFIARPVGGLVLGRFADRHGRKPAMLLSFALMGAAIVGFVLTPSYAVIGMAAPALAILFRLVQGFALGGEVGPNTAYLMEAAPPGRRGLYVSFHAASADAAVLLAGIVGSALSALLSPAIFDAFGWRIALGLGAAIVPLGLRIRRGLSEVPLRQGPETAPRPKFGAGIAIGGLLMLGAATIANYTLQYLTTYAQTTLGMEIHAAFTATLALGLAATVCDVSSGLLSDRIGRKRALILPWALLILLGVPSFLLITQWRTTASLFALTGLLSALHALATGPILILLSEALPARVRATSLGFIYAVAIAVCGGSAQFIEALLIRITGIAIAPAWYMTGALILGLIGVTLVPERRPQSA